MQPQFGELALIVGDFHIPMRAVDVPDKFKKILVPNRLHNVICTGDVGSRDILDWLKSLSDNFVMVKGQYDNSEYPVNKVITIGKYKIGVVHGHQIVPWGDEEALADYARKLDVDILISGHTHLQKIKKHAGKFFVNPGSATGAYSSLNAESYPSFVILEILEEDIRAFIYHYKDGELIYDKQILTEVPSEDNAEETAEATEATEEY